MPAAELVFGVNVAATATLLVTGLTKMTMFKNSEQARAERDAGRRRLHVACVLLTVDASIGALAGSWTASALLLAVASSSYLIAETSPRWMPPLALIVQLPLVAAATTLFALA